MARQESKWGSSLPQGNWAEVSQLSLPSPTRWLYLGRKRHLWGLELVREACSSQLFSKPCNNASRQGDLFPLGNLSGSSRHSFHTNEPALHCRTVSKQGWESPDPISCPEAAQSPPLCLTPPAALGLSSPPFSAQRAPGRAGGPVLLLESQVVHWGFLHERLACTSAC